jgi:4a-hydroxytetrahydrobiopterin dehydratase
LQVKLLQIKGASMSIIETLAKRQCKPLNGAEHLLSSDRVTGYLAALTGWELVEEGKAIRKSFPFRDYYQTIAFVNALAYIAHQEDHHPDLSVHYNRCEVRFSTHDVGGLSQNDFICAAKAQQLIA